VDRRARAHTHTQLTVHVKTNNLSFCEYLQFFGPDRFRYFFIYLFIYFFNKSFDFSCNSLPHFEFCFRHVLNPYSVQSHVKKLPLPQFLQGILRDVWSAKVAPRSTRSMLNQHKATPSHVTFVTLSSLSFTDRSLFVKKRKGSANLKGTCSNSGTGYLWFSSTELL